jgi:hypothetical protein
MKILTDSIRGAGIPGPWAGGWRNGPPCFPLTGITPQNYNFLLFRKLKKSPYPPGMKKRIEPQSTQRPQSFFFRKAKNINHFADISSSLRPPGSLRFTAVSHFGKQNLYFSLSSADKGRKMPEE